MHLAVFLGNYPVAQPASLEEIGFPYEKSILLYVSNSPNKEGIPTF